MGITEELLQKKRNEKNSGVQPSSIEKIGITQHLLERKKAGYPTVATPVEVTDYHLGGALVQSNPAMQAQVQKMGQMVSDAMLLRARETMPGPIEATDNLLGGALVENNPVVQSQVQKMVQEVDEWKNFGYLQQAQKNGAERLGQIEKEIQAAEQTKWENPLPVGVANGLKFAQTMRENPKVGIEQVQKNLQAQEEIRALEREKERINYIRANAGKTFDDNFFGQFGASYALGRMRQDESLAWNKYLEDPTAENRAYAEAIGQLANKFEQENKATLAPDATLPWVSQSLANYLPQFADQVKYSAVGAIGGGAAGSAVPVLGTAAGIKAGITAASGLYSYQTMRGAAFKSLLDLGVDEETAKAAANDEAVVSGLIEMADTGIDLLTLGGGKLITALTKGGVKTLAKEGAEKAAESAGKKLIKALGKYGLNVGFEWTEEATQQAVSIANANRVESGTDNGTFGLAGDAAKVFWNAIKDQEDENHAEILEAGAQGAIIAGLMGPLQAGFNQLAYTGVRELADYGQQLQQKKLENTVIEAGLKFEEGSQVRRMADAISQKQKSGQQITEVELGDLYRAIKLGQQQAYQTAVQQAQEEARQQESTAAQQAEGIMLPTADEVEVQARAAEETNPTRRSGILAGAREADMESAARLSEALGRDVQFFREEAGPAGTVNGYYNRETGTIYINSRSQNPVAQIIAHELTHSVEMAESYGELKAIAMEQLEREGVDIAQRRQELRERYARNNKPLQDDVEADQEIVAQFVEQKLLTDEQTILELTRTNRTLMERILGWINRTLQRIGLKKTTERDTLERARAIYARALQESGREQKSDQAKGAGADADLQEARGYLRRALEQGEITEEEYDAAMETVLEEESLLGVSSLEGTEYSISETYAEEIDQWDENGRPDGEVFVLGSTGDVLQGLGAMEQDIYLRSEKINKILQEHPEMTLEEIKRVPEILDDPVLIMKSRNRKGKNSRLVIFGAVKAKNGRPILSVLDLLPSEGRLQIDDMQKVNSAYTRDNARNYIEGGEILYADGRRTIPLLNAVSEKNHRDSSSDRLAHTGPIGLLRSGSMGSITYGDNTVNISGIPFREIVSTKQPWDNQKNRYSISDDEEAIQSGITLQTAEDVMGPEQTEEARDAEQDMDARARAEGSGDIFTPEDIAEEEARMQGYPVIDGKQIMPLKSWVRDKERGNFGLVTGLGEYELGRLKSLWVLFKNKEEDAAAYVNVPLEQLEWVPGEYQPTDAEINAMMEAEPEEMKPEDMTELYHYLDQRDADLGKREEPWMPVAIEKLKPKALTFLERAERDMVTHIGKSLGIPYRARRELLKGPVREMTAEYLQTGQISKETKRRLFDQAYEASIGKAKEFMEQYQPLRDHLRNTKLEISKEDSADIQDFNSYRKRNFGRLNISTEGGTNIAQVYKELAETWPEFFDEQRESTTGDRLNRISEVVKNFQAAERNLKEYHGPEADTFKKFAYNDYEEAVYSQIHDLQAVARYQSKRQAQQQEQTPKTMQEVVSLWEQYKKEKRTYDKVAARNLLTDRDEVLVGQLLRGEITEFALDKEKNNVKGIMAVYEAKKEYDRIAKELRAWNAERRSKLKELADQYLETANDWKDKAAGILYSRETMERNIRDIVPDKALAQRIIDEYFTPVHKATADATRLKNELRDQVKNMDLSRDVAEGNLVSEAHAVQLLGEAEDNIRFLERAKWKKERDGKTAAEWRKVVADLWEENPNLDKEKIKGAVEQFRTIYDDLFRQMNEVRVRNGYEPINYRSGYFPHFQPGEGDGIIAAFGRALGISTEVTALPTSISGLTHTFKPGTQWFGNALERLGFNTVYDAVEGFDKYIEGAADVIYQTDNIQKLRQFGNQVRYRTTDKGIQKQVDAVLNNDKLSETEKQHQIDDIFANARFSMSNFVAELEEYTNLLANKKSLHDRPVEKDLYRKIYNLMKTLEGRVAANMVSINPASWITNLIPLTQGWAGVRNTDILRGMWDTLRGMNKHDGVVERSTFLTNRRGSDPLVKAWEQGAMPEKTLQRVFRQIDKAAGKAGDKLSSPMELFDNFTSESLIRARYAQNLRKGLSEQNAMDEADAWVAGVMADRSKGAVPTLFMRKNPFTKLVTQFQLEVNNQLSYLFKDIPRETKQAGVKVMTWAFLKFAIGAWLYDELYEFLIGRRPALDPFGILLDTVEDLTEPEEETSLYDTAANLGAALLEQVPFTGALNLFGADLDAGRLPISNAIPDLTRLGKGPFKNDIPANKRADLFLRELADTVGAYLVLPFGGGQLKKILQTAEAVVRGGRYSINNEGEKQLQYPVYNDEVLDVAGNAIFGSVFGPTTLPTGREWIENGFGTLSVDQTIAYAAMKEAGAEDETAFQVIQDYREAENNEERREVIRNADINGDAKAALYYQLMASDKERQQLDILDDAGQDMGQIIDTLLDIKDMDAAAREDSESDDEQALFTEQQMEVVSKAGLEENDAALASVERENIWANRELTTDEKKAEFSQWLKDQGYSDEEQHALYNAVIEGGKSESEAGEENRYVKLVRSGIDSDIAYAITSDISRLEPLEGAESVSREQKREVVFDRLADPEQQLKALETVNLESQQVKFKVAYENGVMPEVYAAVIAELPNYDEDGNGSLNQEEVKNALNSMGRGALTLPGGANDFTLSRQDKAVIWQLCNKSWKGTSNPFGVGVGKKIYDALNPDEKEQEKNKNK